ncbi:protein-glucosylgalactosylhydroxylysine glucosidase-like [Gigantopelta aegis]|uniref:protein-glucosylgalactosylhydroxylysine glucosidase-like n=1 Tax=Gigantopelta aegis TaxID=1735272 RepID=UPI001B8877CC|nr:protein-glucosylgalactosylhydroxylysine glucosidase-like [Gigantopelta aegis]
MKIPATLQGITLVLGFVLCVCSTRSNQSGNKKQPLSWSGYLRLKYKNANRTHSITLSNNFKPNFETKLKGQVHWSFKEDINIQDSKNGWLKGLGHLSKEGVNVSHSQSHQSGEEDINLQHNKSIQKKSAFKVRRPCMVTVGRKQIPVSCNSPVFEASPVPEDATVFKFDKIPSDPRLLPEIGNGHLATVLFSDTIYMNGLYNGANTSSHRARIPSTVSFNISGVSPANSSRIRVLDMGRGVYYERFEGHGYFIEVRQYAHRVLSRLLVIEVVMKRDGSQHLSINVTVNTGPPSEDITFKNSSSNNPYICVLTGETKEAEYPSIAPTTPVTVYSNNIVNTITLPPRISGAVIPFITSISTSKDEAMDYWNKGMSLMMNQTLFSSHVDAWTRLWKRGHIDLTGDLTLSRITYASQYYLLSSLPVEEDKTWPFVGLAPGGLAHGGGDRDYMGHVFWDQDTWMFPPILFLHSDIGKLMVNTRIRTLNSAKLNANETGYKGARYPWESGFTGLEVSPSEACGDREVHITGDVCLAFRQFIQQTNDTHFLTSEQGADAIFNMAAFWISRMLYNHGTGKFEIHGVIPPDEYHRNNDNSVYTNSIAKECLQTAMLVNRLLGKESPRLWSNITANMYIPFNSTLQYHPEFDGYTLDTVVKQADVVMLNYPLMEEDRGTQVTKNDLNIYEKVTPGGPAMTWGIFTINWLELGNKSRADKLFERMLLNAQEPFYIWTENADGSGATNFQTGMGGYLQALIFGYGGFRLYNQELRFNPSIPPTITTFSIIGLDYANNSFDFVFEDKKMTVTMTLETRPVGIRINNVTTKMTLGQAYVYARVQAALVPLQVKIDDEKWHLAYNIIFLF